MRRIQLRIVFLLGLSALLLGCTLFSVRPTTEVTPTLPEASSTPGATETSAPTPTTAPTATPTPAPCPARQQIAFPVRPEVASLDEYTELIRRYLAEGGDPAQIQSGLAAWDALPPEEDAGPLRGDLTGDGISETVAAFINPMSETFPPRGALAVYACRDKTVETLASHVPEVGRYLWLMDIADLTEDGVADLSFTDITCGAHTCWYTAHVWAWTGDHFEEQVDGTFSLPYAHFWVEEGQIRGISGGIGSVGAGPQRPYTETWQWNGDVITFVTKEMGLAQYRYHVFRDGDKALFAEDYDRAFEAYLRVINDETLNPWASMYTAEEERRWFTALAQWRLFTLGMKLGNFPDAEARYERLQADYPPDTSGHPVAVLAERFWTRYQETGNVAYGCLDVVDMPEVEQVLTFLNSFGYANPRYAVEDLCPFLTP